MQGSVKTLGIALALTFFAGCATVPFVKSEKTGLMWAAAPLKGLYQYDDARKTCESLLLGETKGWRLPTADELQGLPDSGASFLASAYYWSSTKGTKVADGYVVINFFDRPIKTESPDSIPNSLICVK